jgi:hypothetical protein
LDNNNKDNKDKLDNNKDNLDNNKINYRDNKDNRDRFKLHKHREEVMYRAK